MLIVYCTVKEFPLKSDYCKVLSCKQTASCGCGAVKQSRFCNLDRCAPPDNRPTRDEMQNCSSYLDKEIQYLKDVRVIVCLGRIAFDAVCRILGIKKQNSLMEMSLKQRITLCCVVIIQADKTHRQADCSGISGMVSLFWQKR